MKAPTKPHPLEPVVLAAYTNINGHDATSLSYFLAGGIVHGGSKAYRTVALDVLDYMEDQGKLYRDRLGWYHLAGCPQSTAPNS
jgi:hypothetical protein